jgi:hypothetical protein
MPSSARNLNQAMMGNNSNVYIQPMNLSQSMQDAFIFYQDQSVASSPTPDNLNKLEV